MSLARFNLSKESEEGINRQIHVELGASYTYLSMATWLSRDTVALHGLADYFREQSKNVLAMNPEKVYYNRVGD